MIKIVSMRHIKEYWKIKMTKLLYCKENEIEKADRLVLRGHHLLCTRLFEGHGYDEAFAVRMGETVSRTGAGRWKNPEKYPKAQEIQLICGSDYVCEKCPNRISNAIHQSIHDECSLGTEDVLCKDRLTLKYAGLQENECYTPEDIQSAVGNITEQQFEEICGSCRWYKAGYCCYEKL